MLLLLQGAQRGRDSATNVRPDGAAAAAALRRQRPQRAQGKLLCSSFFGPLKRGDATGRAGREERRRRVCRCRCPQWRCTPQSLCRSTSKRSRDVCGRRTSSLSQARAGACDSTCGALKAPMWCVRARSRRSSSSREAQKSSGPRCLLARRQNGQMQRARLQPRTQSSCEHRGTAIAVCAGAWAWHHGAEKARAGWRRASARKLGLAGERHGRAQAQTHRR